MHNAEEAIAYPHYRAAAGVVMEKLVGGATVPSVLAFHGALVLVSLVLVAGLGWSASRSDNPFAMLITRVVALIMLLNVFVPHIPAAILLGGYAPGIVTALAINAPLAMLVLKRTSG